MVIFAFVKLVSTVPVFTTEREVMLFAGTVTIVLVARVWAVFSAVGFCVTVVPGITLESVAIARDNGVRVPAV